MKHRNENRWMSQPLSEWDRIINEDFQYVADLTSPWDFDAALAWLRDRINPSDFTWKSGRFFFRHIGDWMLFNMRWC